MACPTPPLKEAKQQGEMSSLIPILGAVADGPGPPVQPLFLTKDDLESDQWQPPRSPVVCPPLPVPDACATMAGEREKSLREAQVGETPAALEQGKVTEGVSGQSFNSGHGIHAPRIPSVSNSSKLW